MTIVCPEPCSTACLPLPCHWWYWFPKWKVSVLESRASKHCKAPHRPERVLEQAQNLWKLKEKADVYLGSLVSVPLVNDCKHWLCSAISRVHHGEVSVCMRAAADGPPPRRLQWVSSGSWAAKTGRRNPCMLAASIWKGNVSKNVLSKRWRLFYLYLL